MTILPTGDRILLKRLPDDSMTAGGLFIPEQAKEKPVRATVVAVGPGRRVDDGSVLRMSIEPGSTVLFSKYSGTEIEIDGEKHLIMREDDVLAVIA